MAFLVPDDTEEIAEGVVLVLTEAPEVLQEDGIESLGPIIAEHVDSFRLECGDDGVGGVFRLDAVAGVEEKGEAFRVVPEERMVRRLSCRQTSFGVVEYHPGDNIGGLWEVFEGGEVRTTLHYVLFPDQFSSEGVLPPGDHVVDKTAESENVHGTRASLLSQQLRRSPPHAPRREGVEGALVRFQTLAQSHVGDLELKRILDKDVGGLEVAVDDSERVEMAHTVDQLAKRLPHLSRLTTLLPATRLPTFALPGLHQVIEVGVAQLQGKVDERRVLKLGKVSNATWVRVGGDEEVDLFIGDLIEVSQQTLDSDLPSRFENAFEDDGAVTTSTQRFLDLLWDEKAAYADQTAVGGLALLPPNQGGRVRSLTPDQLSDRVLPILLHFLARAAT
mmetsp:Transcript_72675/g.170962  ORF Transcript_72675/g.170962 Transcript_72675/m.170962 type:complete len:390 (-) Transcript_72675:102-1271(-)